MLRYFIISAIFGVLGAFCIGGGNVRLDDHRDPEYAFGNHRMGLIAAGFGLFMTGTMLAGLGFQFRRLSRELGDLRKQVEAASKPQQPTGASNGAGG